MSSSGKLILSQHMFGIGGIDRVSVYLANGFARAGFDTEMLVFARGGPSEAILMPQVDSNVRVTFLGERGLARPLDLIRLFPAFVRRLKDARPDAIVSTSNNMNWITCLGVRVKEVWPGRSESLRTASPSGMPMASGL
jgi:hypothetical protein